MKTKCPKQTEHFPKEKDHPYVLCPKIKFHPKNAWQSPEIPLANPKHVNHL